MDQIFDRLERLFKSWVAEDADSSQNRAAPSGSARSSGNSDLDAAMSELDDFLDTSRTETEKREREKLRREQEAREREARSRASGAQASGGGQGSGPRPSGPPKRLIDAYATLGLPLGAPFADAKAAYKRLLMKHHPDRNNASAETHKKATTISATINAAYQLIETWTTTGKLPEE